MGPEHYEYTGHEMIKGVWSEVNPDDYDDLSYGDFHVARNQTDRTKLYVIPRYMEGGDYANSAAVEVSNHRVFLKQFGKVTGVHNLFGGYGTFAVAIRVDVAEEHYEIRELLESLDDYPVIDSDDLSELEEELYDKYWDDWTAQAFITSLKDMNYDPVIDLIPKIEKLDLKWYYQACREEPGVELCIESGCQVSYNHDALVSIMTDRILLDHCKDIALLVGREWQTEEDRQRFAEKLKRGV